MHENFANAKGDVGSGHRIWRKGKQKKRPVKTSCKIAAGFCFLLLIMSLLHDLYFLKIIEKVIVKNNDPGWVDVQVDL